MDQIYEPQELKSHPRLTRGYTRKYTIDKSVIIYAKQTNNKS
jgi:hypothetical protein